jgi:hypothetical protein
MAKVRAADKYIESTSPSASESNHHLTRRPTFLPCPQRSNSARRFKVETEEPLGVRLFTCHFLRLAKLDVPLRAVSSVVEHYLDTIKRPTLAIFSTFLFPFETIAEPLI